MKKLAVGVFATVLVASSFITPHNVFHEIDGQVTTVASAAGTEKTEGDYKYVVRDNGTVKITKYIGEDNTVKIKSRIADKDVTILGSEAFAESECTKVTIPEGVIIIGKRAFADSTKLAKVKFANSIKAMDEEAFSGCEKLNNVVLPEKLKILERSVFEGCSRLKRVTVPENVKLEKKSLGYQAGEKLADFEIRCYEASKAQEYATDNDFDYTILSAKTTATPKAERIESSPEPVPTAENIATPEPTASSDKEAIDKKSGENKASDVAGRQEPNSVGAVLAVVFSIVAIIGCIVVVARRRK